jgi:hypothetical protein
MSAIRKLFKAVIFFFSKLSQKFLSTVKRQIIWLLKTLFATNRRRGTVNAGFVLPTVAMVALVVVLLTTAILFRSFERSKNASNVRVNEATLNAATPAIDRARAKLNKLFQDGRLPRATPTDDALYSTLTTNINEYTFGDETTLKLALSEEEIEALGDDEQEDKKFLDTAWQYPVDTDNNGKFDSYTLYGIYFKNPLIKDGAYSRARNSLEARTPPMTAGSVNGDCGDTLGTSATLVGNTGWFTIGGKLKKAFFAYTATVPIITPPDTINYEPYKGNKGFSALEYQQERVQLPLVNNAVIYEDDIGLTPGPAFKLNGRIFTNSNFLTGSPDNTNGSVKLYQVSSVNSCFYDDENGKIIVGGNIGAGGMTDTSDLPKATEVHLYKGKGVDPTTATVPNIKDEKSVTQTPADIAYNSLAYVQRINLLVDAQMAKDTDTDPKEVTDGIEQKKDKLGLSSYTDEEEERIRRQQLELYFKKRTRRVPFAEVGFGDNALGDYTTDDVLQQEEDAPDTLRPPDAWIYPTVPTDGKDGTGYSTLTLNTTGGGTKLLPSATEPNKLQKELQGVEQSLGDRVLIGNNLPELWWNGTSFVGPNQQDTQNIADVEWDNGTGTRTRRTHVEQLADLGATDRDGEWELSAAKEPTSPQDPVGGLRVVTGAGIYLPASFTTASTDFSSTVAASEIWSDMMPVASATAASNTSTKDPNIELTDNAKTPYLRMRATVAYHYNVASYDQQAPAPIACVSSYYDPTNSTTARNQEDLPNASPIGSDPSTNVTAADAGNSNNGVVYEPPNKTYTDYEAVLRYQSTLAYPNGRLVNEPLQKAFEKIDASKPLTLSEKSAVDSALCALQILDESIGDATEDVIPHGTIMETAFLDGRQIKAIHADNLATVDILETFTNADGGAVIPSAIDYNLPIEDRQPLEIRTTVIDINKLRGKSISGGASTATEYLLPNSGIVYATRDDAPKPATGSDTQKQETQKTESPVDFKLDPTRRPNAIMLINGERIWRENTYRDAEKGLILASNLPVYIKGDFNLHTKEEFQTPSHKLNDSWDNFYSRPADQRDPNFACRKNDQRLKNCTTGDEWRPASVLADAVTLLSNNFRLGFRNEGDFDLNNNLGNANSITEFNQNTFSTNAYAINSEWYDGTDTEVPVKDFDSVKSDVQGSSYLNNFVTPVQRRAVFNEYLMELCPKLPVSACTPGDWKVKPSTNETSWNIAGGIVGKSRGDATATPAVPSEIESGTTAVPAAAAYQRYPRRVAFKRDTTTGNLVLDVNGRPTPLGIDGSSNVAEFPYSGTAYPRLADSALWFKTTTDTSNPKHDNDIDKESPDQGLLLDSSVSLSATQPSQPVLKPILQVYTPLGRTRNNDGSLPQLSQTPIGPQVGSGNNYHVHRLPIATETTFNLAAAAGDSPAAQAVASPSRPAEDNGGLHNFVRFLENWNSTGTPLDATKARISGSFIQFKRSAYATAPFSALLSGEYKINGNGRTTPYYIAPKRQWGYDVGLLSQSPDLFAQKLVRTPDDLPDEYFREVGRDDAWVKTLLCAKKTDASSPYAIDTDQRPSSCKS